MELIQHPDFYSGMRIASSIPRDITPVRTFQTFPTETFEYVLKVNDRYIGRYRNEMMAYGVVYGLAGATNPANIKDLGLVARINNKYAVRMDPINKLMEEGMSLILVGDSQTSNQANPRTPQGMFLTWQPPNGWAGFYIPISLAGGGPLVSWATANQNSETWPAKGLTFNANATIQSKTDYVNSVFTTIVHNGLPSSLPLHCARYLSKNGAAPYWNYQNFIGCLMGPMGQGMFGTCWASGDWLTNNDSIRFGFLYERTTDTDDNPYVTVTTRQGYFRNSGAAPGPVRVHYVPALEKGTGWNIKWTTIPQADLSAPFGLDQNQPGVNSDMVTRQYLGFSQRIGANTNNPLLPSVNSQANGFAPVPEATWTGNLYVYCGIDATVPNETANCEPNAAIIPYGLILEDTGNTNGLFLWNCMAYSGYKTTDFINLMSQSQITELFKMTVAAGRPINCVRIQVGVNFTPEEWNGTTYNIGVFATNFQAIIARIDAAADAAGIPRPQIWCISQWEPQNAATGGPRADALGGAQTLQANYLRELATTNPRFSFTDAHKWVKDTYTTESLYSPTRTNIYGNLLFDALHQSARFLVEVERFIFWSARFASAS
jgi:hypothetical protein